MFDQLYETHTDTPAATDVATTQAADIALDDIDLQRLALAYFKSSREALKAATDKLSDVVHDLSTAGKLADAKSLRHRLINVPLAEARKVSGGLKSKLTAASKAVGAELVAIEAGFEAAEKLITPQIEARDAELAAEKAERERVEAERVAGHRANLAKLAGYVGQQQGKTSAQILAAINQLDAIDIIPEQWEEFAVGAEIQKTETLDALQALYSATKTAEDEAAAREAQRVENERVAAELAEQARLLAERRAELDRQLAEVAAAKKAEADRIEVAAQARRDAEAKAQREAQEAAEATARQAAEDEANRLAQEAAAEALQTAADATPSEVLADAYTATEPADAAEPYTGRMIVSTGVLHGTPEPAADIDDVAAKPWAPPAGPVTFAEPEPAADHLTALLAHIDEAFSGRFPAHPKPSAEWWGTLRRLTDEARESVAA